MKTPPRPSLQVLRVFVSSPGDVAAERLAVFAAVDELNRDPGIAAQVHVRAVAWDLPGTSPLVATLPPQQSVNRSLPTPADCDIVVVVLGERIGSSLAEPRKPDGAAYLSGTDYEYCTAIEAHARTGRPEVVVYRRWPLPTLADDDPDHAAKAEQRRLLDRFFAGFFTADGAWARGYTPYADYPAFAALILPHLRQLVWRVLNPAPPETAAAASAPAAPADGGGLVGLCREWLTSLPAAERPAHRHAIERLAARLERPTLRVAVVGRRKQGKTTLVNALLGGGPLPADVARSTAVPVVARWSAAPTATLHFTPDAAGEPPGEWPTAVADHLDRAGPGRVPPLSVEPRELRDLVPPGDDRPDPVVQRLEVGWPADWLRGEIEISDGPGIDVDGMEDVCRDALADADLVLLVIHTHAQSRDVSFLNREVRPLGHETVLVALTHADQARRGTDPLTARSAAAAQLGVPPQNVFLTAPNAGAELDRLREAVRRAAGRRWDLKRRSALVWLDRAARQRPGAARPLAEQMARLLEAMPTVRLIEEGEQ